MLIFIAVIFYHSILFATYFGVLYIMFLRPMIILWLSLENQPLNIFHYKNSFSTIRRDEC